MLPANLPNISLTRNKMTDEQKPTTNATAIPQDDTPTICSYEGSNYQEVFWDTGERRYEDAAEEVAVEIIICRFRNFLGRCKRKLNRLLQLS